MHAPRAVFNLILLLAASKSASAFVTHLYTTEQCTGSAVSYNTSVAEGCKTDQAGSFLGIINKWNDEADNKLLLATYEDDKCCHAKLVQTFDWADGCVKATGTIRSWRVLDPSDPDKGKEGDTYTC